MDPLYPSYDADLRGADHAQEALHIGLQSVAVVRQLAGTAAFTPA
jgi:hypothetical protein